MNDYVSKHLYACMTFNHSRIPTSVYPRRAGFLESVNGLQLGNQFPLAMEGGSTCTNHHEVIQVRLVSFSNV